VCRLSSWLADSATERANESPAEAQKKDALGFTACYNEMKILFEVDPQNVSLHIFFRDQAGAMKRPLLVSEPNRANTFERRT
jgi:hypothetical protein